MLLINNMLKRPWMCAVKCDAFQTLSVTNEKNLNLKCLQVSQITLFGALIAQWVHCAQPQMCSHTEHCWCCWF